MCISVYAWKWEEIEVLYPWVLIRGLMVHVVAVETFVWTVQGPRFLHTTHICTPTHPLCHVSGYFMHQWFEKRQQIHNGESLEATANKQVLILFLPVRVEYLPKHTSVGVLKFAQISGGCRNNTGQGCSSSKQALVLMHWRTQYVSHIYTHIQTRHPRWLTFMLRACWQMVNIARCIVLYTFEWFLNYILNLDELFQLTDKCVVLVVSSMLSSSRRGFLGHFAPTKTLQVAQKIAPHFCTPLPCQDFILRRVLELCRIYTHCVYVCVDAFACLS